MSWTIALSASANTLDNILQLFGLLMLFLMILAATYIASKCVGQMKLGQGKNRNIKVIEIYKLTANQSLQLVQAGHKYIVISVGKEETRFITELSEDEVIVPSDSKTTSGAFFELLHAYQKTRDTKYSLNDGDDGSA